MNTQANIPTARDALLFTPGPLTTSLTVKQRMLRDIGSWHGEFVALIEDIRGRLLRLAEISKSNGWEVVLLQGSGTYGVESVFQSCVPRHGKVAVLANGAYGERMIEILQRAEIDYLAAREEENSPVTVEELEKMLRSDLAITHVAAVHCETTTGILNPIQELGTAARRHGKLFIVDAMSSFGGVPIDFERCNIDYLVTSSNKCIEGVPGAAIVFCKKEHLMACAGYSCSLSLDLVAQFKTFERDGKFRFTPPTHVLMALHQALIEAELEGGVQGRNRRYSDNHRVLVEGMAHMGIKAYLDPCIQSPIITAFHYPDSNEFDFASFYNRLAVNGMIIYPGKLSKVSTFRIGTIGRIFEPDIRALLGTINEVVSEMGIKSQPEFELG